jgi:dienelactone hydrolase
MNAFFRAVVFATLVAVFSTIPSARAQQEFPPPQGKGRLVVVSSGRSGPEHYVQVSQEIAALGYDVVLFSGVEEEHTRGEGLKTAIQKAQGMPHALPGKVALVGFSAGGGETLYYGSQWADQVAGVVVWYPANFFIRDVPGFAGKVQVPVLVFAGGKDKYRKECCTAAKDEELRDAAKAAGKSFDLVVFPEAKHDFVKGGENFDAKAYADALQRTGDALKTYLAN